MKKQNLTSLLILCILLVLPPVSALAAELPATGDIPEIETGAPPNESEGEAPVIAEDLMIITDPAPETGQTTVEIVRSSQGARLKVNAQATLNGETDQIVTGQTTWFYCAGSYIEGISVLEDLEVAADGSVAGLSSLPLGSITIVGHYGGASASAVVELIEAPVITGLRAEGELTLPIYRHGNTFNPDGLTIVADYSDGSEKDVTGQAVFNEGKPLAAGQAAVKVTFEGKETLIENIIVEKKDIIFVPIWSESTFTYDGTEKTVTVSSFPQEVQVTYTNNTGTNAGVYDVSASFTLAEGYSPDHYELMITAEHVTLTINKATPTGAPACAPITADGKTLADAPLDKGTLAPNDGTLVWTLGDSTQAERNTAYQWTFTPADSTNYNELTGQLTPYHYVAPTPVPDPDPPGGGGDSGTGEDKPSTGEDKPGTGEDNPGTGEDKPSTGEDKPGTGEDKPGTGEDNPGTGEDKPSTGEDKPSTGEDKPSTGEDKPSTGEDKPSTGEDKPSTGGDKPSTGGDKPSTGGDKPSTSGGSSSDPAGTVSGTQTTIEPYATVKGAAASAQISSSAGSKAVNQAIKNHSDTVVIAPVIRNDITSAQVTIQADTVDELSRRTSADVVVDTPVARVAIPNGALSGLSGDSLTVSAGRRGTTLSVTVQSGSQIVESVSGGLTVTAPASAGSHAGTVAVLVNDDGSREVIRKSAALEGTINIPLEGSARVEIVNNGKYFQDVPTVSWAYGAVSFASSHELFVGTGEGIFSPNISMTRGMVAMVLHNMENNPDSGRDNHFSDVAGDAWYTGAVTWAAQQGIVYGYPDGSFAPGREVTREQLAVMLYRYAGSPQTAAGSARRFEDASSISDYAKDAMDWAVDNGIINGMGDNLLAPRGQATRAQVAQMLKNFVESQFS